MKLFEPRASHQSAHASNSPAPGPNEWSSFGGSPGTSPDRSPDRHGTPAHPHYAYTGGWSAARREQMSCLVLRLKDTELRSAAGAMAAGSDRQVKARSSRDILKSHRRILSENVPTIHAQEVAVLWNSGRHRAIRMMNQIGQRHASNLTRPCEPIGPVWYTAQSCPEPVKIIEWIRGTSVPIDDKTAQVARTSGSAHPASRKMTYLAATES